MALHRSCGLSLPLSLTDNLEFSVKTMAPGRFCELPRVGFCTDLAMADTGDSLAMAGRRWPFVVMAQRGGFFNKYSRSPQVEIEMLVKNLCKSGENVPQTLENGGRSLQPPDWFNVLDGIGRRRQWLLALEVFRWIQVQKWYTPDNGYYSKLISIMGKERQYRMAMSVFKEMRRIGCRPDTSLYNSVMTVHLRSEDKEKGFVKALALLEEMKLIRRCQPNIVTYNILARAAAQLGHHEVLDLLFKEMSSRDLASDHYTFNGIIHAYGQAGEIARMEGVLKHMRDRNLKPDEVTFNTLIDAYGKAEEFEKMRQTLSSMTLKRKLPVKPLVKTYNSMITHYGNAGHVEMVESVLKEMRKMGILPNLITYDVTIGAYGKCTEFGKMIDYAKRMRAAGFEFQSSSLNKMLEVYCHHGMLTEAEVLLLNSVKEYGVEATPVSYGIVIRAHSKLGQQNQIKALLGRMEIKGLQPTKEIRLNFMTQTAIDLGHQKRQVSETIGTVDDLDELSRLTSAKEVSQKFFSSKEEVVGVAA